MKIIDEVLGFLLPNRDGHSVGIALFFGAVAVATALIATPFLDRAAVQYAENRAFGIDRVMTGSVDQPRRYTVRRSVLDDQ